MGQFWKISTANIGRDWIKREKPWVRSSEETFAGAAAAKWLGCIRVVTNPCESSGQVNAAPLQGSRARAGLFRESTLKTESNRR